MLALDLQLNVKEIFTAFMVLFAVIDITGSIPIIINLNNSGKHVHAGKASLISLTILIVFLFAGEALLKLFNTDIASFAVAGALILFALAVEMILNIEIFRNDGPKGYATLVPVVFPLIAGAGTLTTTLSLRSQYHVSNIIVAVAINMLLVYLVLRYIHMVKRFLGEAGIYILRKIFGIILLSMAVKLFASNISILLGT
jgi:multiple antibiotic resistance protein